jgi:hypothetical protein
MEGLRRLRRYAGEVSRSSPRGAMLVGGIVGAVISLVSQAILHAITAIARALV